MTISKENREYLADLIHFERRKRKITLREFKKILQEKYNITITIGVISNLENANNSLPNPIVLSGICEVLGIDTIKLYLKLGYIKKRGIL